jgi:RHS repeat-associated protein
VVSDALGSVRLVLDTSASTVSHFEYDAWGNLQASSVDSLPPGGMMYRYVGAYGVRWDPDTGLHYVRRRWYDAELQRFASLDVMRYPNRSIYGNDNPVTYVDSNGMKPSSPTPSGTPSLDPYHATITDGWGNQTTVRTGPYDPVDLGRDIPLSEANETLDNWGPSVDSQKLKNYYDNCTLNRNPHTETCATTFDDCWNKCDALLPAKVNAGSAATAFVGAVVVVAGAPVVGGIIGATSLPAAGWGTACAATCAGDPCFWDR